MAEVNHFYSENTTQVDITGTSASPTTIVTLSGLSGSTKYLVLAKCVFGGTDAGDVIQLSAGIGTWDNDGIARIEPTYTTIGEGVSFFRVWSFTTSASPETLYIKGATFGGGADGWADQASLLAIDLDDLGSGNYVEATTASTDQGEISSSSWGTTDVTISHNDLTANTDYLLLGYARHQPGSTGVNYHVRLMADIDADNAREQQTYHSAEGEDTAEYRVVGVMGYMSLGGSRISAYIQSYEDATNGNWHGFGAYLIAIDVSAFADFDYSSAATGGLIFNINTYINAYENYTPSTNGNHLILSRANYTSAGADSRVATWTQDEHLASGTHDMPGDSSTYQTQNWDPNDAETFLTMSRESISAQRDIAQVALRHSSDSNATSEYEFVCVLNLNLAAGAPPFRRRQLTTVRM